MTEPTVRVLRIGPDRRVNRIEVDPGAIEGGMLSVDAIDGKTITGAVLQTGTTGGRTVIKPGVSTINKGQSVIQMYSGQDGELYPAEIVTIIDGPNPADNASLLIMAPGKEGVATTPDDRAGVQIFARDTDTSGGVALIGDFVSILPSTVFSGGGIVISNNAWTAVSAGNYGSGVSAYSGAGYVPGVRWRRTHDNMAVIQFGLQSAGALTANPILVGAGSGIPAPSIHGWTGARCIIGSANEVLPIAILNDGRIQLLRSASATYTLIAGTITYPLD